MTLSLIAALLAAVSTTDTPPAPPAPKPEAPVTAPDDRDAETPAAAAQCCAPNALNPEAEEKLGWLQGKIESLEEQFIENKNIVAGLSKLKISGYVQARYTYLDA